MAITIAVTMALMTRMTITIKMTMMTIKIDKYIERYYSHTLKRCIVSHMKKFR